MTSLADHDLESLQRLLAEWGHRPGSAAALLRAYHDAGGAVDVPAAAYLPKDVRARFGADLALFASRVLTRRQSDDGTVKLLVGLDRGGAVECVLMPAFDPRRAAGCVSSQVGCAMGCDFCASTKSGLERDLAAGEIVEQFLHLRAEALRQGRRLQTLVFMGMGEPMHNLPAVVTAIGRITRPALGNLGPRNITVSTVGIVPGIDALRDADLGVHLAVSLHAPDDDTRARIVPTGRRHKVAEIVAATHRFADATGRIPTIEYCLLADVNDADAQAHCLADVLGGLRAHVNLIPYNWIGPGVSGAIYRQPSLERMQRFIAILRERRVVAHFRRQRGDDVSAACGQLRETLVQARVAR